MTDRKRISRRRFTCVGCERTVEPDGTPQTRAFIWTDVKTKERREYCYRCDDRLIQGVSLPKWRVKK